MNDQIKIDQKEEIDGRPLGKIALSLSGGGGRAAGFHLGTLAYLDHVDLLKDVSILSSVSGGSVIAAKYALTQRTAPEEEPLHDTFRRFYKEFFDFCMNADLVRRVFKKLGDPPERHSSRKKIRSSAGVRKSGRQNAVLAVADIYDENLLNRNRFGVFWDREDGEDDQVKEVREIHIKELIFNATEFKTGLCFRFHKGAKERRSGNRFVPLPESWARKARLADIVAASSCIPIGMEPIFFPQDFRWPEKETKLCDEIQEYFAYQCGSDTKGNKVKSVSLMDGGVYDNQGADSVAIALAEKSHADLERADMVASRFVRKYAETPIADSLGTLIISDTPLLNDNIYPAPDQDEKAGADRPGRLTLGHLNMIARTFAVLSLLMVYLNFQDFVSATGHIGSVISEEAADRGLTVWETIWADSTLIGRANLENFLKYGMPIIAGISWLIVFLFVRSKIVTFLMKLPASDRDEKAKLDEKRAQGGLGPLQRYFLARRRWKDLRNLRISTLIKMMSLRLSSTWALTGTIFLNRIRSLGYSLMENRKHIENRIIKHEIYGIVEQENKTSKHAPSAQMLAVAQRASSMETALWYEDEAQLNDLVACGQFTMCYNLLEHMDKLSLPRNDQNPKAALYKKLEEDWRRLRKNPFKLIKEVKRPEGGTGNKDSSTAKPNVRVAKA